VREQYSDHGEIASGGLRLTIRVWSALGRRDFLCGAISHVFN
jgi:hypothetical protein